MRVLVTGVNGFVGKHLARELTSRGLHVFGLGREANQAPELQKLLNDYWACDLMDQEGIAKLPLGDIDAIINLAGLARVGDSFSEPEKYMAINVGVLRNLCEVLVKKDLKPKVIAVSTAGVYAPNQPMPLTEGSKLAKDGSPYAMSKILMEQSAREFSAKGLKIVVVRPFNHIGPGQEEGFLVPDLFVKLRAAQKSGGVIKIGSLSTKRDYTDVRDVARAYAGLVEAKQPKHKIYNICSGKSTTGEEVLKLLLKLMGLEVRAETDPALLRPNEIMDIYGSNQRLHGETGWQPKISLQQTLEDFIKSKA